MLMYIIFYALIMLYIPVPPHFTRTPTDVETHEGVDIELPCSAHGDPRPGIKWVKDDVILENDSKYRISADGYLIIRQVQQGDQGIYRCEAVNGVGTAFAAVRVNVRGKSRKNIKIFVTFVQSLKAYNYNNKLRTCVDQANISLNFIKEVQKTSVV